MSTGATSSTALGQSDPVPTTGRTSRWLLAALSMAAAGQWLLDGDTSVWPAVVLLGAGALIFGLLAPRLHETQNRQESPIAADNVRWRFVLGAILLGALALPGLSGNRYTLAGAVPWIASLGCIMISVWPRVCSLRLPASGLSVNVSYAFLVVVLAMAIGAFYRLHRITTIPLEMGCDLPLIQSNIGQILSGDFPIFFYSHPGREGLFFYLAAPVAAISDLSHTSIKVVAALVGILTLPAVYMLGRELFDPWVGALAALFMAISHWHIILSRIGYRAVLVPLLVALSLGALIRALRNGHAHDYALCGLWVGLGLQSYNGFMVVPPLYAGILVLAYALRSRINSAITVRRIGLWCVAVLLTALPLIRYIIEDPQRYLFRAATRVTAVESALPTNLVGTWIGNLGRALGMFNNVGDSVFLSNVPGYRQLGFLSAMLFILGAGYLLTHFRRGCNWTLCLAFLGLLLPSTLSLAFPEEVPSAVRAIGVLPVAMLLPALGARVTALWLSERGALASGRHGVSLASIAGPVLLSGALVAAFAAETASVYPLYFERYVASQPDANASLSLQMARTIDDFYEDGEAYILTTAHWYDGNAVRAQLRRAPATWDQELWSLEGGKPPLDDVPGRVLVITHPEERDALELLRAHYAQHIVLEHRWNDGRVAFQTFYGER